MSIVERIRILRLPGYNETPRPAHLAGIASRLVHLLVLVSIYSRHPHSTCLGLSAGVLLFSADEAVETKPGGYGSGNHSLESQLINRKCGYRIGTYHTVRDYVLSHHYSKTSGRITLEFSCKARGIES